MHDIRFLFVQQQFIALPSMKPNGESALNHGNPAHSRWEKLISIVSGHHPKRVIEWQLDGLLCTYLSNNIKHRNIFTCLCIRDPNKNVLLLKVGDFSYQKKRNLETSEKTYVTTNCKHSATTGQPHVKRREVLPRSVPSEMTSMRRNRCRWCN